MLDVAPLACVNIEFDRSFNITLMSERKRERSTTTHTLGGLEETFGRIIAREEGGVQSSFISTIHPTADNRFNRAWQALRPNEPPRRAGRRQRIDCIAPLMQLPSQLVKRFLALEIHRRGATLG